MLGLRAMEGPRLKPIRSTDGPREDPADLITSPNNRWIKLFRAALRGAGPSAQDLIGVEGRKLVEEGFCAGLDAEALLISTAGENNMAQVLRAAAENPRGIRRERILRITDKMFRGIAGTETPQGIAALFHQPLWGVEDILRGRANPDGSYPGDTPLVVVLAGVQDPGNVGTILRSAEAFGATGGVATRGSADPWAPKALRASAGSALRLPLLRGMAIPVLLAQLKMHQVRIVAASIRRANGALASLESAGALLEPVAIFIGNEGGGLPGEVEHAADAVISIPMSQSVESLNAGVAASLLLYEAARQRKAG